MTDVPPSDRDVTRHRYDYPALDHEARIAAVANRLAGTDLDDTIHQ